MHSVLKYMKERYKLKALHTEWRTHPVVQVKNMSGLTLIQLDIIRSSSCDMVIGPVQQVRL